MNLILIISLRSAIQAINFNTMCKTRPESVFEIGVLLNLDQNYVCTCTYLGVYLCATK